MVKIQVRRGSKANLPTLSQGEFGLATDTSELFIGNTDGNVQIASQSDLEDGYLPLSGGTMTGNIQMSSQKITSLGTPTADTDAATKGYVDDYAATRFTRTATLTASGWTQYSDKYQQVLFIQGVQVNDTPHITCNMVGINDVDEKRNMLEAWSCVSEAISQVGNIIFNCFDEAPQVDIDLIIEVIR